MKKLQRLSEVELLFFVFDFKISVIEFILSSRLGILKYKYSANWHKMVVTL